LDVGCELVSIMTDEEKRAILDESRRLLAHKDDDGVRYSQPYDNSATYDEDHVPIPDLIREPYGPKAWRQREHPRQLDTAPPSPPSIDWNALDERTKQIVDQAVESAIQQERQRNFEFMQAVNRLAVAVLDTLDKMKRDVATLEAALQKLGEKKMPRVDDLVDDVLDRLQERQRQRLHAH
jgi:hypothetical protein